MRKVIEDAKATFAKGITTVGRFMSSVPINQDPAPDIQTGPVIGDPVIGNKYSYTAQAGLGIQDTTAIDGNDKGNISEKHKLTKQSGNNHVKSLFSPDAGAVFGNRNPSKNPSTDVAATNAAKTSSDNSQGR